ncbi:MAG: type VI secretion system protein TssA [Planctomycetota bacterium]|nr:type VI secretion system protein TssA [Planctomycetota bacterium]
MSVIDTERATAPVAGDDPCGPRLTDEIPVVMLLEKAKGTPEAVMGDSVRPAEEPNWSEVRSEAMDLLGQTKELWVAMLLVVAGLRLGGLPGFREGLGCVHALLERYWDGLHPRPDEDGDPYERLSALSALGVPAGTQGDDWKLVERIRSAPLTDSRQIGRFSIRDIALANGEVSPREGEDAPTPELIAAAFEDTEIEFLTGLHEAATEAMTLLEGIQGVLDTHVGVGASPDFSPVRDALRAVSTTLAQQLERRGYAAQGGPDVESEGGEDAPSVGGAGGAAPAAPGEIRSGQDVTRALDRVIEYYVKNEPSSPVPLLLRRAQRLVSRSFLDIIRDLSPEGLDQVRMISGEREDEDET